MTNQLKPFHKKLLREIEEILFLDWNPIGGVLIFRNFYSDKISKHILITKKIVYGFNLMVLNPIYWIRKIFGTFEKESEEIVSICWKK